jgi:cytidine deaminase
LLATQAVEAANQYPKSKVFSNTGSAVAIGSALMTKEKMIFTGCNFERVSSYAGGISAEDCAVYKALSEGCPQSIKAIAIHTKHIAPQPNISDTEQ